MTPIGAILALLVAIHVEGFEVQVGAAEAVSTSSNTIEHRHDPNTERIVDIFNRPREGKILLPQLELPGFGSEYDDCGDEEPHFCESCYAPIGVGRTCDRNQCPRCAASWARRRGAAIVAKLEALRKFRYSREPGNMLFHHITISPPAGRWYQSESPEDALEIAIEQVKDVCEELDLQGYLFYHPWSGKEGDDRGAWKRRLFKNRPWDWNHKKASGYDGEPVRGELKHRPHFHIVAVGPAINLEETGEIEERSGWVIHRITEAGSNVSIRDLAGCARAVMYALSHTGIKTTANGNKSAQYRGFGADINDVVAYQDVEEQADRVTRAVAPKVLGIPFAELACTIEYEERHEGSPAIGLDQAMAEARAPGSVSSSSSSTSETVDVEHSSEAEPEKERCEGRILHISRAPEYLEDDERSEAAPHTGELREAYARWEADRKGRPPPD